MRIEVRLELMPDGKVDIKSTTQDIATIILIMEKAKFEMLKKIEIREKTGVLVPGAMN